MGTLRELTRCGLSKPEGILYISLLVARSDNTFARYHSIHETPEWGQALTDSAGLNDLNQSRTLLTNKARRQADTELHIGRPERVQANEVLNEEVDLSLRHHGSDGTILVLTRIDVSVSSLPF